MRPKRKPKQPIDVVRRSVQETGDLLTALGAGRLVLTRKRGDEVVVFDNAGRPIAIVSVAKICGSRVQFAIRALPELQLVRGELLEGKEAA